MFATCLIRRVGESNPEPQALHCVLIQCLFSLVLVKFTNSLVRSRPLKEIGAEQLLIDLQSIKAFLTRMPGEELATNTYARSLNKTTSRLEALLKVIVTPVVRSRLPAIC